MDFLQEASTFWKLHSVSKQLHPLGLAVGGFKHMHSGIFGIRTKTGPELKLPIMTQGAVSLSGLSPLLSGHFPNWCGTSVLKLLPKLIADQATGGSTQSEVGMPCGSANPSSLTSCAKSLRRELFNAITFSIIFERSLKKNIELSLYKFTVRPNSMKHI